MNILDNQKALKKIDRSNVAVSIASFSGQLTETFKDAAKVKLPVDYRNFQNIVFCGMGGSNLASELVRSIFGAKIKKPLVLIRGYHLPGFASEDSLVIVSSYSGDTEEPLNCLKEAIGRRAKIVCLSAGGRLAAVAREKNLPLIQFKTRLNPSGQPRYGLGIQLGAVLAVFNQLKIIKISEREVAQAAKKLSEASKRINPLLESRKNPVKKLAMELKGYLPIVIAADHLKANAHIFANQLNESAKTFCPYYFIPELNHHLLEGLAFPGWLRKKIKIIFLNSNLYSPRIAKRFIVTEKVLAKQKIAFIDLKLDGKDKLIESLSILAFSSWVSFYLAILNKQKPAAVPWVDYFKKELKK
ncbi:MAG: SIS domain-containing protein [Patescibacteria group bacterium]